MECADPAKLNNLIKILSVVGNFSDTISLTAANVFRVWLDAPLSSKRDSPTQPQKAIAARTYLFQNRVTLPLRPPHISVTKIKECVGSQALPSLLPPLNNRELYEDIVARGMDELGQFLTNHGVI